MSNDTACSVPECERTSASRGWCHMHYLRWRKHGNVLTVLPSGRKPIDADGKSAGVRVPLVKHFMSKVSNTDYCWVWSGGISDWGYGEFWSKGAGRSAHRAAYELFVGPIPDDMQLDHTCHTNDTSCAGGIACKHRRCVNPDHLEPVTDAENKRRGNGPAAINARKTHCKRGHEFTPENTYNRPSRPEWRVCRKCRENRTRTPA